MPSIEDNKSAWDGTYNWIAGQGDEWSAPWGGPSMQWYGTILPRIKAHIPTTRILEIACGYGRWTQYLKDFCESIVVVDLSEKCIIACQHRFANCSHIEYHTNDGKSLDMIQDSSIDFVFSFDALVHVDDSVMQSYIRQLQRILKEGGIAFLHHSNLGEYRATYLRIRKIPKLEGLLKRLGVLAKELHWRDFSVDASKIKDYSEKNGLICISQEIIPWVHTKILIPWMDKKVMYTDCISTIVKRKPAVNVKNRMVRNYRFMEEAQNLARLSQIYDARDSRKQGNDHRKSPPRSTAAAARR